MNAPPAAPTTTPSSEILHLVNSFTDTVDAIPPSITRNLSDLKELDAVLSGALHNITSKIQRLLLMMHDGETSPDPSMRATPLERLNLLREVTEDARVFRLGGEDKIRVATGTCETIATQTSHLSTLSTLLLNFLPTHLLPQLPPPTATHGYPSSVSPLSIIAKRQNFDYNTFLMHPSVGSTGRVLSAKSFGLKGAAAAAAGGSAAAEREREKDRERELQRERDRSAMLVKRKTGPLAAEGREHHPTTSQAAKGKKTAREREKEREENGHGYSANGNGFGHVNGYSGMATQEEYNAAMGGAGPAASGAGAKKRKVEDGTGQSKRRKKASLDVPSDPNSPLTNSPLLSNSANGSTGEAKSSASASAKAASRRAKVDASGTPTTIVEEPGSFVSNGNGVGLMDVDGGEDLDLEAEGEEPDGNIYCFCLGQGIGDMIGCDRDDCETEWFHLNCVGLTDPPKGKWFCDDCKKRNSDKTKKRR